MDKLQLGFTIVQNNALNNYFLLILGVAVHSGRLFSIAKAGWGLESCSLYGVERWLLYIEVIVVSIWT